MRIAQQQNIKLESRIFEPLHRSELFELMYALSTKDIDIKVYFDEHTLLKESFFENERFLLN
jgi:hypothetical protein